MTSVNMDFEAWLTLACLITGLVWLLDKALLARRRGEGEQGNWFVEFARSFFPVLLAVLLLRSFVFEPFRIPSKSMVPTLLVGDFVLVNKFSYGLRTPVFHYKFVDLGEPERGDIVVFRYPRDPSKDYIKRIIGLPGDRVTYRNEHLYVNGKRVPLVDQGVYTGADADTYDTMREFREKLPGGTSHQLLHVIGRRGPQASVKVPPGHYFAMGDNRDNSADSRIWGFVPERNLVGKAFLVWMSIDIPDLSVRWHRIGHILN